MQRLCIKLSIEHSTVCDSRTNLNYVDQTRVVKLLLIVIVIVSVSNTFIIVTMPFVHTVKSYRRR